MILLFLANADLTLTLNTINTLGMNVPPYTLLGTSAATSGPGAFVWCALSLPHSHLFVVRFCMLHVAGLPLPRGMLALDVFYNTSEPLFRSFRSRYLAFAPTTTPLGTFRTFSTYDATYLAAHAIKTFTIIRDACASGDFTAMNALYPSGRLRAPLPSNVCAMHNTSVSARGRRSAFLYQLILNTTFTGVTGPIVLDGTGDRISNFWLVNSINSSSNAPSQIGTPYTALHCSASFRCTLCRPALYLRLALRCAQVWSTRIRPNRRSL